MSYLNQELTIHRASHTEFNPNCEYCAESGLQRTLREMKGSRMPSKTLFGDLNNLVPKPYAKFKTMDNP